MCLQYLASEIGASRNSVRGRPSPPADALTSGASGLSSLEVPAGASGLIARHPAPWSNQAIAGLLCLLVAAYRQMVVACGRGRCPGRSAHQPEAPVRPGPRAAPIAGHTLALAASINAAMGLVPPGLTGHHPQAGQTFWPA